MARNVRIDQHRMAKRIVQRAIRSGDQRKEGIRLLGLAHSLAERRIDSIIAPPDAQ